MYSEITGTALVSAGRLDGWVAVELIPSILRQFAGWDNARSRGLDSTRMADKGLFSIPHRAAVLAGVGAADQDAALEVDADRLVAAEAAG